MPVDGRRFPNHRDGKAGRADNERNRSVGQRRTHDYPLRIRRPVGLAGNPRSRRAVEWLAGQAPLAHIHFIYDMRTTTTVPNGAITQLKTFVGTEHPKTGASFVEGA